MGAKRSKAARDSMFRACSVMIGIGVNVLLALIGYRLQIPLYLDSTGIIVLSVLGGYFPGIFTAVASNMIFSLFSPNYIFFGTVNALIAIYTVWFVRRKKKLNYQNVLIYIFVIGTGSGILSAIIQWGLFNKPESQSLVLLMEAMASSTGIPDFLCFIPANIIVNIADKSIGLLLALIILHFVPERVRVRIKESGWRQKPLSDLELENLENWKGPTKITIKVRIAIMLIAMTIASALFTGVVGIRLYFENERNERTHIVETAAKFAAGQVDPEKIGEYIADGRDVSGYEETEEMLYNIRENASGVVYLSIIKYEEDKEIYVFDLDGLEDDERYENELGYSPGDILPLEDAVRPYQEDLLSGNAIPVIETKNVLTWSVSAYSPIVNELGQCVAYARAEASVDYLVGYMRNFQRRVLMMISGVLILLLAVGLWSTSINTTYPIKSIGMSLENIVQAESDQAQMDEAVRQLRAIDIRTGDELEKLYHEICDMAVHQTEQLRSIRRFSEHTAKMQDGLIITMADLVENRDSDTGAHIQKTAAYVRIIVEGLQKKGYYAGKIDSKFISDVVRSAPLHDIGKINISDSILNKPGKLTEEEYEVIKTHTIAGKQIMEKAIDTVGGENYLKEARNMAAYHHERWDGNGYPEGLHGEVIPLSARIMAVADVFDALTSSRVYKKAFSLEQAISMLQDGAGSQFDPKCVEVFVDAIPEIKIILRKYNKKY